ncbi:MAG: ABC transporter transmembrane domain-containing protein, partial [Pseudomonas sp.]
MVEVAEVREEQQADTGLACLVMLARFHNLAASPEQLAHEFAEDGRRFGQAELLLAAKRLGLKAKSVRSTVERLAQTPLPAIAADRAGRVFIIARLDDGKALIHDPLAQRPEVLSFDALEARWAGVLFLLRSEASLAGELSKFDFSWFIPAIVKYRKLLGEVLLVSFVLQIFALLTPLFFQVVMDKVLVHRGLSTLDVIAVGLLGILLFETALSGLRSYVFAHTASRIDVELGSRLFRHLVTLPLAYFQARRVGDSVARVRELENIRSFLTGNAITLLLDVLFSVVFIAVMFVYSGWLTLVVLLSLPLYFLISLLITPVLRARLNESFSRGAENQAFLVETVNGIDTLK